MKVRVIWTAGAIASLFLCFALCRFLFFDLHEMKQFPVLLFVIGLIVLGVCAIGDSRKAMVFTVAGYISGFAVGMLFETYGTDQGGGATSNAWIWWTGSFFICVLAGFLWEHISRRNAQEKRNTPESEDNEY